MSGLVSVARATFLFTTFAFYIWGPFGIRLHIYVRWLRWGAGGRAHRHSRLPGSSPAKVRFAPFSAVGGRVLHFITD